MIKRFNNLIDYILFLYKQNRQNAPTNILRVVNCQTKPGNKYILEVQVINKASIFKCKASVIAGDDKLLECFSKRDVRMITFLASKELLEPNYKISSIQFNNDENETIFHLKNITTNEIKKMKISDLSANKILSELGQEDAYKLGYTSATEEFIKEQSLINNCQNSIS